MSIAGADKFVVVKTSCESKKERRDLTSQANQLNQPLKRGKNLKDEPTVKEEKQSYIFAHWYAGYNFFQN